MCRFRLDVSYDDAVFGRGSLGVLAALAAVRVAVPLAALAASGTALPGQPRFDYVGLTGDATGFYAATREFLAAWGRLPVPVLLLLVAATVGAATLLVWAWRRRAVPRAWLVVAVSTGFGLLVCAAVTQMEPPGAAVFGWPLVWSLPMLPYRALGGPLDPDVAFGFGVVLSLAANVVTVVATAYAGLYATGRRSIGLAAAASFALWPFLVGLLAGERAWENGTWAVDTGLAMYTEPLSTALVTVALALLLAPRLASTHVAVAGVALSLATAVKLSNALLAGAALALVGYRLGARRALPYVTGALAFAPLVLVYWPKGYDTLREDPDYWPAHPFSADYLLSTWTDSLVFRPRVLILLVPLAALGAFVLGRWWPRFVLGAWIVSTAAFYSFYSFTWQHPRFLFATLPALFVLWAAGAARVLAPARRAAGPVRSS